MKCIHNHLSGDEVAAYWLPHGCICFEDQLQFLCDYHAWKIANNGWEIYEFIYWGA